MPLDNFAPNDNIVVNGYVNFITANNEFFITANSLIFAVLGEGFATLQNSYWSDIPLIREGFVIVDNDTGAKAVLTETPKNQSKSVAVQVFEGFPSKNYPAGSWSLYVPEYTDLSHFLPRKVREETEMIPAWLDVVEREVLDEIDDSIKRLLAVREWDNVDIHLLNRLKNTLGLFIDTNDFTTLELRRLIQELPYFYEISGTDKTIDFLGYILDTVFEIKQLWTKNYTDFINEENVPANDKDYYPTPHISLEYDVARFSSVDLERLKSQFYKISPIQVVIEDVIGLIQGEVELPFIIYSNIDYYTIKNNLVEKEYYPPDIEYRQAYGVGYYINPGSTTIYTNTIGRGNSTTLDITDGGTDQTYYNPKAVYQDIFG